MFLSSFAQQIYDIYVRDNIPAHIMYMYNSAKIKQDVTEAP